MLNSKFALPRGFSSVGMYSPFFVWIFPAFAGKTLIFMTLVVCRKHKALTVRLFR